MKKAVYAHNPVLTAAGHQIVYTSHGKFSKPHLSDAFIIYDPKGKKLASGKFTSLEKLNIKRRETRAFDELIASQPPIKTSSKRKKSQITLKPSSKQLPRVHVTKKRDRFFFSKKYNDYIETRRWNWDFEKDIRITENNSDKVSALLKNMADIKLRAILTQKDGEGKKFFLIINHRAKVALGKRKRKKTIAQEGYSNRRTLLTLETLPNFLKRYFDTGWIDRQTNRTLKAKYSAKLLDYLSRLMSASMYVTGISIEMLVGKGKPERPTKREIAKFKSAKRKTAKLKSTKRKTAKRKSAKRKTAKLKDSYAKKPRKKKPRRTHATAKNRRSQ